MCQHIHVYLCMQSTVKNVDQSTVHQLAECQMSDETAKTIELAVVLRIK